MIHRKHLARLAPAALALAAVLIAGTAAAEPRRQLTIAIAEAQKAQAESEMDAVRLHLRYASNCLDGRESGSWYAPNGDTGPCTDRLGVKAQIDDYLSKERLTYAGNLLGSGRAQSDVLAAHDKAEDAVKLMQKVSTALVGPAATASSPQAAYAPAPDASPPAPALGSVLAPK